MTRTLVNFWLDVILLVCFLAALWATVVIRVAFPPGTAAAGWVLWGWTYDHWFEFQFWVICTFAFVVLLHVMMHWSWICGVVTSQIVRRRGQKKRQLSDGERTLFGVGLLVVLLHVLGFAVFAALLSVHGP